MAIILAWKWSKYKNFEIHIW